MKRPSVIPEGVRLEGEIEGEGDLVVFGHVEGPIHVDGGLVIEEGGIVRGHVHARSVTVRGAIKGDAYADETIRVDGSGRLVGDLTAPRVRVTPGARFAGQVHVQAVDVPPPLRAYDPALHTFTGLPAPGPISDELARGVSVRGAMAQAHHDTGVGEPAADHAEPDLLQERPTQRIRERPSRVRTREAPEDAVEALPPTEALEEPITSERKPVPSVAPAPSAPPRTRMPRLGRVRGSQRGRRGPG